MLVIDILVLYLSEVCLHILKDAKTDVFSMRSRFFNVDISGAMASMCGMYFRTSDLFSLCGGIVLSLWLGSWGSA